MSRPFSYNDENFTVIDNILFVHLNDRNKHQALEPVIPIPDEIYKRMGSFGSVGFLSPRSNEYAGSTIGVIIVIKK